MTRMGSIINNYNLKKKFDLTVPIAFLKQKNATKSEAQILLTIAETTQLAQKHYSRTVQIGQSHNYEEFFAQLSQFLSLLNQPAADLEKYRLAAA